MRNGFEDVTHLLTHGVEAEYFPGAVLVVGYQGQVVYEAAVGHAALIPSARRMTVDTVFDLASLTKPIATATALMLLVETGRVGLMSRLTPISTPGAGQPMTPQRSDNSSATVRACRPGVRITRASIAP